jgi:hypothetical protein
MTARRGVGAHRHVRHDLRGRPATCSRARGRRPAPDGRSPPTARPCRPSTCHRHERGRRRASPGRRRHRRRTAACCTRRRAGLAVPGAEAVDGDRPVGLLEVGADRIPLLPRVGLAGEQHERLTGTGAVEGDHGAVGGAGSLHLSSLMIGRVEHTWGRSWAAGVLGQSRSAARSDADRSWGHTKTLFVTPNRQAT